MCWVLDGAQMQGCIDQVHSGAQEGQKIAERGQTVVPEEGGSECLVLGVLLSELGVLLLLGLQPNLTPQTVLPLHLLHLQH